ncbi:MAG: AarF/UbiB family protein [Myxococcota bacterium]|nr:AarF/UbiB family protein [Myxococcota bacterium]
MNVRDLGRLQEIAAVLVRHGFGHLVAGTIVDPGASKPNHSRLSTAARLRQVLIELGPTFVKLGQVLSVRPDILPSSFIKEFESLQDRVDPIPFDLVKTAIEREWGMAIEDRLLSIDEQPLASASIAQVHKAVTVDGDTVAIKVQRPEIERRIRSDLHILYTLAALVSGRLELPGLYTPVGVVQEFEAAINLELDFLQEARAATRFRALFRDHPDVMAPLVYEELTTGRVLVLELLQGRPLSSLDPADREAVQPMMDKLIDASYLQVFEYGFFHGDPHPGNLMLLDDGRLAYLDFGVTGTLTGEMQDTLMNLFMALVYRDAESVALTLYRSGAAGERVDLKGFSREVERLITKYHGASFEELSDRGTLMDFVQVASRYRIRLVTEFAVLARAMSLLDGVSRRFMPDMDIVAKVTPYAQRLVGQRLGPDRLGRDALRLMQQVQTAVRDVPLQLNQMMMDLQTGNIDIGMVDRESDRLRDEIRWVGLRLSMAMIAAALGVAGALLLQPFSAIAVGEFPVMLATGLIFLSTSILLGVSLVMHTLFAARIHPREWVRRWFAVVRFFLPGKK